MPWLASIAKWLAPLFLDKLKDWFLQWYEKRRLAKKQAEAVNESAAEITKEVIEAPKPEMTDEERVNAQKAAWSKYIDWFKSRRL